MELIGLAGSVAAGKSTLASELADRWRSQGLTVAVVSTDGFLLPNATLEARGLLRRKGFPESYDAAALQAFLQALRTGQPALAPHYSHQTYDIVPGQLQEISGVSRVLIEGVNALQPAFTAGLLDLRLYLHADEADLFSWYRARLLRLRDAAQSDPDSYFTRFLALTPAEWEARIQSVWEEINLPNLRAHIAPSQAHADWVFEKAADHRIVRRYAPGNPEAAWSLG